jgi:peptide/nickel transport system ATP-binding protein
VLDTLLDVRGLCVGYDLAGKWMQALDHVSFELKKGEVLGVAGESGCGKSTLGLALMRLLPTVGKIVGGSVQFMGRELLSLSEHQMDEEIRGKHISMIFQNPQSALNPVFRVENQMIDILRFKTRHRKTKAKVGRKELRQQAIQLLRETGIADPMERISDYPFEYSGGMKQRVMIAMALSSKTSLLIADEPTTALDVTIGAQINQLIATLAAEYGSSVLYISHNPGILSELADRTMIMYAGRIFEMGKTEVVFGEPRHPYSNALLQSLPDTQSKGKRLLSIPGFVPPLDQLPSGCSFHPRCPFSEEICHQQIPSLLEVSKGHWSSCLIDQQRGQRHWKWT